MAKVKESGILIWPCAVAAMADETTISRANSKTEAARKINKFLAGRDGDDYDLTADDIVYNSQHNAYFIEE